MRLRPRRRTHWPTHRAIATVVAVSLLSMPVTYKGGADAAHAHTIFQLWADVGSGSFAHHAAEDEAAPLDAEATGGGYAASDHAPTGDEHAAPGHAPTDGHVSDAVALASAHVVHPDRHDGTAREPVRGSPTRSRTSAVEVDPDAPTVSSAFTPSVRGSVLTLPAATRLPTAGSVVSPVGPVSRLTGVVDAPTPPPPRRAA